MWDTRKLVKHVRQAGAMNAIITSEIENQDELAEKLSEVPSMENLELSTKVTTKEPYILKNGQSDYKVAVLDIGVKKSILSNMVDRGCELKVFPAKTSLKN